MNGLPTPNTLHAMWWSKPRASAICSPMPVVKRKPAFYWQKPQLHPSVQLSEGKWYPVKLGTRLPPLQFWFAIRKKTNHCEIDDVIYVLIGGWWVLSRKRWEPVKLGPVPTPVCFEATRKRLSLFLGIFAEALTISSMTVCVCVMCYFSSKSKVAKLFRTVYPQRSTWLLKSDGETASKIRAETLQDLPEDTLCDTMQLPRDTPSWEHDQAKRMISSSKPLWGSPVIALCIQFASEIMQKTKRSDQESKRKRVSMLQITDLEDDLCLKHSQKIKNMLMFLAPGRRGHLRGQLRRQAPFHIRLVPGGCILVICCDRCLNFLNQEIQVFTARSWSQSEDKNS